MRLSVRRMLALVAVLAVPFAFWGWRLRTGVPFPAGLDVATIAVTTGFVSAGVIAVVLIRASRNRPRLLGPMGWGIVALNVAVTVWFTSVERAFIVEQCPACGHGNDVFESRFFSVIPRRVVREFPTVTELIAGDLGIPKPARADDGAGGGIASFGGCLWGECFIGITRLSDPPWFPPCARDTVRSWASKDPNFIRNFRERALEGRDRGYARTLVSRMYAACPDDQTPAHRFPEYRKAAESDSPLSDVRNQ